LIAWRGAGTALSWLDASHRMPALFNESLATRLPVDPMQLRAYIPPRYTAVKAVVTYETRKTVANVF